MNGQHGSKRFGMVRTFKTVRGGNEIARDVSERLVRDGSESSRWFGTVVIGQYGWGRFRRSRRLGGCEWSVVRNRSGCVRTVGGGSDVQDGSGRLGTVSTARCGSHFSGMLCTIKFHFAAVTGLRMFVRTLSLHKSCDCDRLRLGLAPSPSGRRPCM